MNNVLHIPREEDTPEFKARQEAAPVQPVVSEKAQEASIPSSCEAKDTCDILGCSLNVVHLPAEGIAASLSSFAAAAEAAVLQASNVVAHSVSNSYHQLSESSSAQGFQAILSEPTAPESANSRAMVPGVSEKPVDPAPTPAVQSSISSPPSGDALSSALEKESSETAFVPLVPETSAAPVSGSQPTEQQSNGVLPVVPQPPSAAPAESKFSAPEQSEMSGVKDVVAIEHSKPVEDVQHKQALVSEIDRTVETAQPISARPVSHITEHAASAEGTIGAGIMRTYDDLAPAAVEAAQKAAAAAHKQYDNLAPSINYPSIVNAVQGLGQAAVTRASQAAGVISKAATDAVHYVETPEGSATTALDELAQTAKSSGPVASTREMNGTNEGLSGKEDVQHVKEEMPDSTVQQKDDLVHQLESKVDTVPALTEQTKNMEIATSGRQEVAAVEAGHQSGDVEHKHDMLAEVHKKVDLAPASSGETARGVVADAKEVHTKEEVGHKSGVLADIKSQVPTSPDVSAMQQHDVVAQDNKANINPTSQSQASSTPVSSGPTFSDFSTPALGVPASTVVVDESKREDKHTSLPVPPTTPAKETKSKRFSTLGRQSSSTSNKATTAAPVTPKKEAASTYSTPQSGTKYETAPSTPSTPGNYTPGEPAARERKSSIFKKIKVSISLRVMV